MPDTPITVSKEALEESVRHMGSLHARCASLELALKIAMAYMPHGDKYEGPLQIRSEDAEDFETCRKALRQ